MNWRTGTTAVAVAAALTLTAGCRSAMDKYTEGRTPEAGFLVAAWEGDLEAVNEFLASGIDANVRDQRGSTALIEAAGAGRLEVVQALIGKGADVSMQTNEGWS